MSGIFTKNYEIKSTLVNAHQDLRTSQLFVMLQDAATEHVTTIGMGKDKTYDRGILWVVARQFVQIERMPVYDEVVSLRTWAGKAMHVLFPRYYEISDKDGNVLVKASAVWSLMDINTRNFVSPEDAGIIVDGVSTGTEIPYRAPIKSIETTHQSIIEVPFSYVDLNGHMNNSRYFDAAEDIIPAAKEGRKLSEIRIEYHNEIKMGQKLCMDYAENENGFFISGSCEKPVFKMLLKYR